MRTNRCLTSTPVASLLISASSTTHLATGGGKLCAFIAVEEFGAAPAGLCCLKLKDRIGFSGVKSSGKVDVGCRPVGAENLTPKIASRNLVADSGLSYAACVRDSFVRVCPYECEV